jgi:hypothetical protein
MIRTDYRQGTGPLQLPPASEAVEIIHNTIEGIESRENPVHEDANHHEDAAMKTDPQTRQRLPLVRQWQDEDYDVFADGKVVGRIYEDATAALPELRWFWSVTAIVPATPGVTNGTAATREEAMAKFRAAWEKAQAGG